MFIRRIAIVALLSLLGAPSVVLGGDLYTLTGTTTSGLPVTVTASGSNFLRLVQDAVASKAEFQTLQGRDAAYALSYAGQPAITLTKNAAGTSATLSIPSTGFSKTFTGADAAAVRGQVREFVRSNAQDAIGQLNRKIDEHSKVGVVDGNPHAASATVADDAFYRFALPRQRPELGAGWWITGNAGTYHADGINGSYGDLDIGFDAPLGNRAALSIGFLSQYNRIEDANAFTIAGLDVGLPITLAKTPLMDGLIWKVTPFANGAVAISPDTLSGGGMYGLGGASSLSFLSGPWTFTLGNQIEQFFGVNLGVEGRSYGNRRLDQLILKNGVNVTYSPNQHLFIDGGLTYTNFLEKAGVPDYLSPTVGIGYRFTPTAQIRIGGRGDLAAGYTSVGAEISLTVSY